MRSLILLCFFLLYLAIQAPVRAQERTWTNVEGKTIQGTFLGQDEAKVKLRLANGKESVLSKTALSPADNEYLASLPADGLQVNSLQRSRTSAFDAAEVDLSKCETTKEYMGVGGAEATTTFHSPHYRIVCSTKVSPAVVKQFAESAERLYLHFGNGWPGFRKATDSLKMLIFLPQDTAESASLYTWMMASSAAAVPFAWSTPATECAMLRVPAPDSLKVTTCYRKFALDDKTAHGNTLKWPARIHYLAITWAYEYLYRTSYVAGDDTICGLVAGLAYAAEMEICGKVQTFLTAPGSLKIGLWADPVKRLVASGELNPNVELFMKRTTAELTVPECALAWSLIKFFQDDSARLTKFHSYLDKLHTGTPKPSSRDLAKAVGFANTADFNKAWAEFIASGKFR